MHCSICGYSITENDLICPKCGAVTAIGKKKSEQAAKARAVSQPPIAPPVIETRVPPSQRQPYGERGAKPIRQGDDVAEYERSSRQPQARAGVRSGGGVPQTADARRRLEQKLEAEATAKKRKQKIIIIASVASSIALLVIILIVILLVKGSFAPQVSSPVSAPVISSLTTMSVTTSEVTTVSETPTTTTQTTTTTTTPAPTMSEVSPDLVAVLPANFGTLPDGEYSDIASDIDANKMVDKYKGPLTGALIFRQQNMEKLGLDETVISRLQKMMTQSSWSTQGAWSGKTLEILSSSFPFATSGMLMPIDLAGVSSGVATLQQAPAFVSGATAVTRTYFLKHNRIAVYHAEQVIKNGQVVAWMEWQINLEPKD